MRRRAKSKLEQMALLVQSLNLPSLGDEQKRYPTLLSQRDINAIHAAFGFMLASSRYTGFQNFWAHYGPTMQQLSERLEILDDSRP